jgi:hypothetical protein
MATTLNQVERDFVEFMALDQQRPYSELEMILQQTRRDYTFGTLGYRELCVTMHNLWRMAYDDHHEQALIEAYQFHELHLFRFLLYSYAKHSPLSKLLDYGGVLLRLLARREVAPLTYQKR